MERTLASVSIAIVVKPVGGSLCRDSMIGWQGAKVRKKEGRGVFCENSAIERAHLPESRRARVLSCPSLTHCQFFFRFETLGCASTLNLDEKNAFGLFRRKVVLLVRIPIT
uniref:Secreted protein n=1 Tax=Steinernema glaseri TaxID=37863 RepID=A0A1I7ZX41_9BILA